MPVIGTAGHVDHGKSTLIEALTGRDPDRWAEEKRRGLTIDLGFAWAEFDGVEVGFVDVPGHEKFIKNMLSGIEAVQAALLVVAADEGWMPQSEEHLAVLDLLEIDHCVVALTRVDLADAETLELAELEVLEKLEGTSLEGSPVVRVSAPRGQGTDELRSALAAMVERTQVADVGRPRLWVDRAFAVSGAGTVVTGTLVGGSLEVGSDVMVWPGEHSARVRSLQSHEAATERVAPGNRAAASLVGVEVSEAARGAMVGIPGQWLVTDRALVDLRTVRMLSKPLKDRGAYHFHIGSGAVPARLRLLEGDDLAGSGAALLSLSRSVPLAVGDRFILREVGRRAVVGGGRVLDPAPRGGGSRLRAGLELLRSAVDASPERKAETLLQVRGREDAITLAAHSGGGSAGSASVSGHVIDQAAIASLAARAVEVVTAYHQRHPLRTGIPRAELAEQLGLEASLLEMVVTADRGLTDEGTAIRAAEFEGGWGPEQEGEWETARRLLEENGLAVPRASQLGLGVETSHALERDGRLLRIDEDLVYLPDQVEQIEAAVAGLGNGFTVAEFRDALGITRRHAVPLLEWLDRRGVTRRTGDLRSAKSSGE